MVSKLIENLQSQIQLMDAKIAKVEYRKRQLEERLRTEMSRSATSPVVGGGSARTEVVVPDYPYAAWCTDALVTAMVAASGKRPVITPRDCTKCMGFWQSWNGTDPIPDEVWSNTIHIINLSRHLPEVARLVERAIPSAVASWMGENGVDVPLSMILL